MEGLAHEGGLTVFFFFKLAKRGLANHTIIRKITGGNRLLTGGRGGGNGLSEMDFHNSQDHWEYTH